MLSSRSKFACATDRGQLGNIPLTLMLLVTTFAQALERLEPVQGCYFGINVGTGDSVERLTARLGMMPAMYVDFFSFPLTPATRDRLAAFLAQIRPTRGMALITLEPSAGLNAVTDASCMEFAQLCATNEALGIQGIMVRFAHEMNGNWYPWGQQPFLFKEKFQLLSSVVRTNTTRTAMLWAPNNGIGYPFGEGLYRATPGSADFVALDTNDDGQLTPADDMYEPYYPGNDAVDWVGMTIYHWGANYPWLENELPPAHGFANTLRGTASTPPIPDFYTRYCNDGVRNKPLAIPETAAFFNTQQPAGAGELAIKRAWWRQTFNAFDSSNEVNIATEFPKLKAINWFDHLKVEAEAQAQWIDWRISASPLVRSEFLAHLSMKRQRQRYFLTAPDVECLRNSNCIVPENVPYVLPVTGAMTLTLEVKAAMNCDLVVDLLDETFNWYGGTRLPAVSGLQTRTLSFPLIAPLADGQRYRWSIFLTPTGSNYLGALAWHVGPRPVARRIKAAISVLAAAPVIAPGAILPVRFRHTSPSPASFAHVKLFDAVGGEAAAATNSLPAKDGVTELEILLPAALPNGDYSLQCFLSESPTNYQSALASSSPRVVQVNSAIMTESVQIVPPPSSPSIGEVLRFEVSSAATIAGELRVELLDETSNAVASTTQAITAGSSVQELVIAFPMATPGAYFARPSLTHTQLAIPAITGVVQRVTILAPDYANWVASRWGVVLGNDSILPGEDADGDGANNDTERLADTSPLDSADALRLRTFVIAGQITLTWPSVTSRRYQLFETADLEGAAWTAVGAASDGTGEEMPVTVLMSGTGRKFYRVEALPR